MDRLKVRIVETKDFSQDVLSILKKHFEVHIGSCSKDEIQHILETYDVFWFRLGFQINSSVLSEKTRCKVIATPVTGIDHIDEISCARYGVKIICLRGQTTFLKSIRATAEHTLLLTLMLLRHVITACESVKQGTWDRDSFRGNEVYSKTVGIIGVGRLGSIVAEYFKMMGAHVIGYDTRVDFPHDVAEQVYSLADLASRSDIVTVHVAYNSDTHNLLSKEFFSSLKKGAVLINTARGGILDEDLLLDALYNKSIAGAALDVVKNEYSISINHPLIEYAKKNSNLIITPHIGGNTYESFHKTEFFLAESILHHLDLA